MNSFPEVDQLNELQRIRGLLFTEEKQKIQDLEVKYQLLKNSISNKEFVKKSIEISLTENKNEMVNIMYPMVGSMVRKSVSQSIKQVINSLDQMVAGATSFDNIKWRWESFWTGIPLAKVIFRHTAVFRVEHVFLIHKKTSKLLNHQITENAVQMDKTSFGGMLGSIQDFSEDIFGKENKFGFQSMEVDGLNIWLNAGRSFLLAIVVRGVPSLDLRRKLSEVSDRVESKFGAITVSNVGQVDFFKANEELKNLLIEKLKGKSMDPDSKGSGKTKGLIVFSLLMVGLGFLAFKGITSWRNSVLEQRKVNSLVLSKEEFELSASFNSYEENKKYLQLINKVNSSEIYVDQKNINSTRIKDLVSVVTDIYFKSKEKKVIVVLEYKKGFAKRASVLSGRLAFQFYKNGILDHHFVRIKKVENSRYPVRLKILNEELRSGSS